MAAIGAGIDSAVHLQITGRSARETPAYAFGTATTVSGPVGRLMEKLSAVRAERDEGDDVHFFAAILRMRFSSAPP
jgi:hypothetical protein